MAQELAAEQKSHNCSESGKRSAADNYISLRDNINICSEIGLRTNGLLWKPNVNHPFYRGSFREEQG